MFPLSVTFTANLHFPAEEYRWDVDNDGIIDGYGSTFQYTYQNIGTYSVKLTTRNGTFESDNLNNNLISVQGSPIQTLGLLSTGSKNLAKQLRFTIPVSESTINRGAIYIAPFIINETNKVHAQRLLTGTHTYSNNGYKFFEKQINLPADPGIYHLTIAGVGDDNRETSLGRQIAIDNRTRLVMTERQTTSGLVRLSVSNPQNWPSGARFFLNKGQAIAYGSGSLSYSLDGESLFWTEIDTSPTLIRSQWVSEADCLSTTIGPCQRFFGALGSGLFYGWSEANTGYPAYASTWPQPGLDGVLNNYPAVELGSWGERNGFYYLSRVKGRDELYLMYENGSSGWTKVNVSYDDQTTEAITNIVCSNLSYCVYVSRTPSRSHGILRKYHRFFLLGNAALFDAAPYEGIVFSPDSASIAYRTRQTIGGRQRLFVSTLSSAAYTVLSQDRADGDRVYRNLTFSSDSQKLYCISDDLTSGVQEIYRASANVSGSLARVIAAPASDRDVTSFTLLQTHPWLVALANFEQANERAVFLYDLSTTPTQPRRLCIAPESGWDVAGYMLDKTETWIAFIWAEKANPAHNRLYITALDGSQPAWPVGQDVVDFQFSPAGLNNLAPWDLRALDLQPPASVAKLASFNVAWSIRNNANVYAPASGWSLKWYLSHDAQFDSSDTLLNTLSTTHTLEHMPQIEGQTSLAMPGVPGGSWYLLMRIEPSQPADESDSSNNVIARAILVQPTLPQIPTNPSPADGATSVSRGRTLAWAPAPLAESYSVKCWLSTTSEPTTNTVANLAATSWTAPALWPPLALVRWRVTAVNGDGATPGPVWSFTAAGLPPALPQNLSPANAAQHLDPHIALQWISAGADAVYDVYLWPTGQLRPAANAIGLSALTYTPNSELFTPASTWQWQVVARNPYGEAAGPVWTFRIDGKPAAPNNPTPADGATSVSRGRTLAWDPAPLVQSYSVKWWLATTSEPTTNTVANLAGTSWTAPALWPPLALVRWRVTAVNGDGSTPGPVWSFTAAGLPPALPQNLSPANAAQHLDPPIALQWSSAGVNAVYDIYVWPTGQLRPAANAIGLSALTYAANSAPFTPTSTWQWQVVARNDYGEAAGPIWSFRIDGKPGVPANPTPADGATSVSRTQMLAWQPAARAQTYAVKWWLSGTSEPTTHSVTGLVQAQWQAPEPWPAYETLHWRVTTINADGATPGPLWTFEVPGSPPVKPELLAPISGTQYEQSITFRWAGSTTHTLYDLYLWKYPNDRGAPYLSNLTRTQLVVDGEAIEPGASYRWQLRAHNQYGEAFSEFREFLPYRLATPPSNPFPANGATDVPSTATLQWDPSLYATLYHIYVVVQTGDTYTTQVISRWPMTYFRTSAGWPAGSTVRWRVSALGDLDWAIGPEWTFTTGNIPAPPTYIAPANGARSLHAPVVFEWQDLGPGVQYDLWLRRADEPNSAPIAIGMRRSRWQIDNYTFEPGVLYYWKVEARNTYGTGPWGPEWSFRFDASPEVPSQPSPADGAIDIATTRSLAWVPSARATGYRLKWWADSDPEPAFDTVTSTTQTSWTAPAAWTRFANIHWRVTAFNADDSTAGPVWNFTVKGVQPMMPGNPSPASGTVGLKAPIAFSWSGALPKTVFDFYLWKDGQSTPASPTLANLPSASCIPNISYEVGARYHWRVAARNPLGSVQGPVWNFTVRSLIGNVLVQTIPTSGTWQVLDGQGVVQGGQGTRMLEAGIGTVRVQWLPLAGHTLPAPAATSTTLSRDALLTFTGVYTSNRSTSETLHGNVLRYLLGLTKTSSTLDVNRDGRVDAGDLLRLQRR